MTTRLIIATAWSFKHVLDTTNTENSIINLKQAANIGIEKGGNKNERCCNQRYSTMWDILIKVHCGTRTRDVQHDAGPKLRSNHFATSSHGFFHTTMWLFCRDIPPIQIFFVELKEIKYRFKIFRKWGNFISKNTKRTSWKLWRIFCFQKPLYSHIENTSWYGLLYAIATPPTACRSHRCIIHQWS